MDYKNDFNIFIGGKTGCFKGVKLSEDGVLLKNLRNVSYLTKESEISALEWGDTEETDILIGTVKQLVRVYDSEFKAFSSSLETKHGEGPIVGITRVNDAVTTCSESGHVKVWKYKESEQFELNVNGSVSKMKATSLNSGVIGTGGKGNDFKIWNVEKKAVLFQAKNVRKSSLELEMPVWITDIAFVPECEYKGYVSTRHGQVRLYDTKAQRRPVINLQLQDKVLTAIALNPHNINQVVVGSGSGHVVIVDVRASKNAYHSLKGSVGSVRSLQWHKTLPYIASVGLDRFLRVHDFQTQKLLHEKYLKIQLNCLLMRSHFDAKVETKPSEKIEEKDEDSDCVVLESDEEYEEMFDNMETIDEPASKKRKNKNDV